MSDQLKTSKFLGSFDKMTNFCSSAIVVLVSVEMPVNFVENKAKFYVESEHYSVKITL